MYRHVMTAASKPMMRHLHSWQRQMETYTMLRSFAPRSSRGLAKGEFPPFRSTCNSLNNEVTRAVTCFARVVTNLAGIPEKIFQHVFRFGVFSQSKSRGLQAN